MESDRGMEQDFAILFADRGDPLRESPGAADKNIRILDSPKLSLNRPDPSTRRR